MCYDMKGRWMQIIKRLQGDNSRYERWMGWLGVAILDTHFKGIVPSKGIMEEDLRKKCKKREL